METSFGHILKSKREAKGLTIKQISDAIKITTSMIHDIESENFERLPQPVFLRGLVKTYCRELDIEETEVLEQFDSTTNYVKKGAKKKLLQDEYSNIKTPTYVWLSRIFIPIFIISCLAATGAVIVFITKKYDKEIRTVMNPNVRAIHTAESEKTEAEADKSLDASETEPLVDPNVTQVITLEPLAKTVAFVKVDDAENQKIILIPEVNKTFQALNRIKITLQDGGSVNIIHNKKDIGVPGVFGEKVELNFPKN